MTRQARRSLLLGTALAGTLLHGAAPAAGLPVPTDPATAGLAYNGANTRLDVDLANTNRIINWNSFDVAKDNVVNFTTANTATRYSVLNRVAAGDASDIFGTISTSTSNIAVWLVNPSGITFGSTGSFSGGSLVLTTAAVGDGDWANAIASADPASYLVRLTGAPVPVTVGGVTTGAIQLLNGSSIATTGGRFVAAAQSVTAAGRITATGGEAELVAATDLSLPFGAGSPLGVQIDKGTSVGRVTVEGTAEINASVIRLAGASTGAQAAYLLQVDDGASLTASAINGKVILAAGTAADGVALGTTPANVSGAASIRYDGKASATGTGATAMLNASGDITSTTANGTITADQSIGLTAAGNIAQAATLTTTTGNIAVNASGTAAVRGAVAAGGDYSAQGTSLTLGTAGTAIVQQAKGTVQATATNGLLSGLDGLTLQSGSAGAAATLTLRQAGAGGIVFAPASELIGGTFTAGPPASYGYEADVAIAAIAAGQPLTLGNVHARALALPAGLSGTITAGDLVVNDTLTLNTSGSIRLRSGISRTGDVALTATGDVTGLARAAAATDGRIDTGYDRADLTALAADKKVSVSAATAQLGTLTAGAGLSFAAGDQVAVDAQQIDVVGATASNGTLRLTSTLGEARLGTGTAGADAVISAATSVRLGSLTAATGVASATASNGDVTGLRLATAATDGRLVTTYGRADITTQGVAVRATATAANGNVQLGAISAGSGVLTTAGEQVVVDARAIDVTSATSFNNALHLTATAGEVRLGTGIGGSDATVAAATSVRIGSLTATRGDAAVTATDGDVTGLARTAAATDGRLVAGYDRADIAALANTRTVRVMASAGNAQLGSTTAGTGTGSLAVDEIAVDAQAIELVTATATNGALRLTSTVGEVRLGTGTGNTDAIVSAATSARIGSLTAPAGAAFATAVSGDITGLALATPATDGRLVAGYGRADIAAQSAAGTATVQAALGNAQLGTLSAGTGTTVRTGEQARVDAQAIDVTIATAGNAALRLTSTVGEVRLGGGTAGTDAIVSAATSARIGSLTARTGAASVTAVNGDVTGLVLATPATDGRLVAGYGSADIAAQSAAGTATVQAALGNAQLGTFSAGTGTTVGTGEQARVDAQAIDTTTATASNAALRLTSTVGEVRLGTGTGNTDGTVDAATSARIGSLTARAGTVTAIARNGDVTGLLLAAPATDGRLVPAYDRATLTAQAATGTIAITAALGTAQLGTALAGTGTTTLPGNQIAVNAQAIDVVDGNAANGALRLVATLGEVRLVTGSGGTDGAVTSVTGTRIGSLITRTGDISVTATGGDVTGLILPAAAGDGRLVDTYGRVDLTALTADRTITVAANGGYAQLGTVTAGTGTTLPAGDQIAVDARAIDAITATALNGALRLTSTVGEVRLASGRGGTSGTVDAATSARVGDLTTRAGAISITARNGDATGLAIAPIATDARPEAAYGLITLDAGTSIAVRATDDVQLGTIRATTDIDVDAHPVDPAATTADQIAWLAGTVTADSGHYRVTGGSVVLGAPGGIGQSAGADLIVRSLAGDITGGDGLALTSGVGSTSAANPLILYSAGTITLPVNSTLTAGGGQFADIGLAAQAGRAIALGSIAARRIGTAAIDATQPTGYRVERALALPNPIIARRIVTAADLVIDTSGNNTVADIVLDEAQSTAGGINLATLGDLRGRLVSAPDTYQRTQLGAFDGVVVTSRLALLDAVTAGTGADIAAGRIDALAITANAGDIALQSTGDMRVDSVIARGDGGNGLAVLLADPTIPLSVYATPGIIRTAGDIAALSGGDITGTASGTTGLVNFTATNGAVTAVSTASATGKGLLALDQVTASGTTAGHSDVSLTGRQIDVANRVASTAGSVSITARELGSQTRVGATIARVTAARDVDIAVGYGTAPGGTADNGSLRFGMVQANGGNVTITARDGSVTGLAGAADGLDPAHARPAIAAGGNVTVTTGRIVQLGELSGQDVAVAGGDDVVADVAQQGVVAHQDGAIDIAHLAARGTLTLTAAHGPTDDGVSGIRLGALASGLSDGGVQSTAGSTATLRTIGTRGDIVIADGLTAQGDLTATGIANIRASTLTSAAGGIALTAIGGDITGLILPSAATDGRMRPGYDRANLTPLAAAQPITARAAAGVVQLGTVTAGAGLAPSPGEQVAIDAQGIDVVTATAQNGALRLTSTGDEVRLVTGTAGTDATVAAASNARIGTLTTRTGSILATAAAGDVTGLLLPAAAGDGRLVPAYDRATLTSQATGSGIAVKAAAGIAQLGPVTAGAGDATATTGGIAVDARAIDVGTATAQNAALRLTSTAGEVRLARGTAGSDAAIAAATSARIGTLTTRTGSIGVAASGGDVTGLAFIPAATDGRMLPDYGRAVLTAQAERTNVTVDATGTAQLDTVTAGTGDGTATTGGIAVTAAAIDLLSADARNAALKLTSTSGETRLVTGTAGTDAVVLAANAARIGTLTTRTGGIAVTATAGDVTGLVRLAAADDVRLVPGYDRADLTAQAAAQPIAVKAAAGNVQLGTALAGAGLATSAGDQIAVDARAIDVTTASARNGALRLTATAGEARLATGTAGTNAAVQAATSARIGALATRTGSIAVTAAKGDATGLALAPPAGDGRMIPGFGRADLIAQGAATNVSVNAGGIAQLGTVRAGDAAAAATAPSGGITVTAAAIDLADASAFNAALKLMSTIGETRLGTGTAATDASILAANAARIGTLTSRTGSIAVTATAGDVTGLVLPAATGDGRLIPAYGRADLIAQSAGKGIAAKAAAGTVQLGTASAGAGLATSAGEQIAVDARAIDILAATAQNGALRLTSTAGEARLATGAAGTDANIAAQTSARIGTLTTRTGSIAVTATAGDVTGLVLAQAQTDGRIIPGYNRADLTAQAAGTNVTVTAAAGTAQLGTVSAGNGDATAPTGGIAVSARAIDIATAAARNAALRLASTVGDVRLGTGIAGTDAAIQAATNARIGTLAARTGSVTVTAGTDVTGLASDAAADGRIVPAFGRADLSAQAAARDVTVTAGGTAQIGTLSAGTGTATTTSGGIAVTAGAIDITNAAAQNAALTLTSTVGETRLATGTAATDAAIRAGTSARIGSIAARTGSIGIIARAGDVTGLALASGAGDGRLVTAYGRADLTASAAGKTIAISAATGSAQLGAVTAGTGTGTLAGDQVAVDARAIDVTSAAARDGALRLASTAGETRIVTGTAATDATINAATSARIGDLTARTGALTVTAATGDVTGLATTAPATDGRPFAGFGRANLIAPAATRSVTVTAAAGTAQLGTVTAGGDALSTGGGGIAVTARGIDVATANARNGALALTATADRLYLGQGVAATTATLDKRGTADELHITDSLAANGNATLISTTDIDLPVTPARISSGDTLVVRNSGANATSLGTGATGPGFTLTEAEVNSLKAPKLMIDARANAVTISNLAVAAAAGSSEVDLLGTGGFTLRGAIANSGGAARTLQIGGAAASTAAPNEAAIEAGTTLASGITGELENGAAIDWTGGTLDLRSRTILFGNQALRSAAVGTPDEIATNLVSRSNSPLYSGALGTALQGRVFLRALKLKVSYTGYALFQNTSLPAIGTGVVIGPQNRSATTLALQLASTGEAPPNSFALFGTINGFDGRTAGVLPAEVIDFADASPRVVRITQSSSRINGCVIGSPDKGCLVTDAPPLNFRLFDERQVQLFGTADDAGLTFDPLIGTNNESLIGEIDQATLGINSIDCSVPGTRDCPATGEKQ